MTKALKASAVAAVVLAGNALFAPRVPPERVPEPAPLTLLGAGLLALCVLRGRVAHCDPSYRV